MRRTWSTKSRAPLWGGANPAREPKPKTELRNSEILEGEPGKRVHCARSAILARERLKRAGRQFESKAWCLEPNGDKTCYAISPAIILIMHNQSLYRAKLGGKASEDKATNDAEED